MKLSSSGLPIPPETMMSDPSAPPAPPIAEHGIPIYTHPHAPATLPELACNWHVFWRVSGPVYMPESLGPSRIIIINSKRLYHPIRDMGRPELRIPPYIALHPPVHPCRDFPKIFYQKFGKVFHPKLPKIPETSRKDGAKIFPKKLRKVTVRFTRNPAKSEESAKREQM